MPIQSKQQPPYYSTENPNYATLKEFTTIITQTGTSAPTITELKNTLGEVTPQRYGVGSYGLHTQGLLTPGKTYISGITDQQFGGNDIIIPLFGNSGKIRIAIADEDDIYIDTYDNADLPIEWNSILGTICFPTILVYP